MSDERRPRIVDFSTHMSGPIASHLLAEMGADVIKVERPGVGDGNRGLEPQIAGTGMFHLALNSGTRSIQVDAKSPEWPRVVEACARWADVVIVGLRPVDAVRRGLDFASISKANPSIVYCLISGYGEHGPWSDFRAHGQTLDALAGLVPIEWRGSLPFTPSGWRSTGTTLAGVFGALGALAGLYLRDHGEGAQHVSVSIWGSAMWWSWRDITCLANSGEAWTDYSELGTRYSMYPTKDGRAILIAASEKALWAEFCDALDLPEDWKDRGSWDASGMDHGEGAPYEHERDVIAERMRQRTMQEWWPILQAAGVPFAPILTIEEALNSDHARSEGVLRSTSLNGEPLHVVASPVRFGAVEKSDDELDPLREPPKLGAQTREILAELGLDLP